MSMNVLDEPPRALPHYSQYQETPARDGPTFGPREVVALLRRRLVPLALVILAGAGLTLLAAHQLPRIYTGQSMVVLEPDDPNILDENLQQGPPTQTSGTRMDTQADLMSSRVLAGRVVDHLNLIAEPDFNRFLPDPADEGGSLLSSLLRLVKGVFWSVDAAKQPLPPAAIQREAAISSYLSRLSLKRNGESLAMTVAVDHDTPEMAAQIANATVELFIEWSREVKREHTRELVEFLRQQGHELASRIATIENELAKFSRTNKVSSDPRDDLLRASMQQINEQLSTARADHAQASASLAQVTRKIAGGAAVVQLDADPLLASDFLRDLRNQEAPALRDRAQLARNYGSNHPLVKEADARIASVQSLISQEMSRIVANLENDVRVAQERIEQFETELAQSEQELRRRGLAEIRLRELGRDLLTEQKLYDVVAARLGKLDPYAEVAEPNARIVSYAEVPSAPSFPKLHILTIGGFVGSLVLGLIVALTLDALDTGVRDGGRINQLLGVPSLATIPRLPKRLLGRGTRTVEHLLRNPRSGFAEAFRTIYSMCKRMNGGRRRQTILVGSSNPREGRTSTAIGLAVTAALDGARAVLLDLNFADGRVHDDLKPDGSKTLAHYFRGACSLQEILQPSPEVPQLDILAVFRDRSVGARVLTTCEIEKLISRLAAEYDFVIIDTPAASVADDIVRVGALVDQVVLVAAFGGTREEDLQSTAERLRVAGAPLVGVVVTRVGAFG